MSLSYEELKLRCEEWNKKPVEDKIPTITEEEYEMKLNALIKSESEMHKKNENFEDKDRNSNRNLEEILKKLRGEDLNVK